MNNDIMGYVEQLNKRATQLNQERDRAVWARDEAKKKLETALNEYNQRYGTNLTIDGIEGAYNAELAKIQEQAEVVQTLITKIESGEGYEVTPTANSAPTTPTMPTIPTMPTTYSTPNISNSVPTQQVSKPVMPAGFSFDVRDFQV